MQSRLRVAGQAVHPLLLMFPLGLFALALILDVGTLGGAPPILGAAAHLTLVTGLVGGTAAASAAWFEAASAPRGAVRAAFAGVLLDLGVLVVFAVVVVIRLRTPGREAGPGVVAIESAGLAAAAFSAWYAGRLDGRRGSRPVRIAPVWRAFRDGIRMPTEVSHDGRSRHSARDARRRRRPAASS